MPQNNKPGLHDITGALRLLTRLPLRPSARITPPQAAWAWPLAGAIVGALAALVAMAAQPLGAGIAAALVLGIQAMMTGALHEDGLADTADGLWGGWDKARRLLIMKDSHIGTYGVMALLVVGLVRWSALAGLIGAEQFWVIVVVGAMSRAPMALLMAALPNARGSGLSQTVGQVPRAAAGIGVLIATGFALTLGAAGLVGLFGIVVAVSGLAMMARAKIGGQTGDILGASQQLAEATALCLIAAHLT
ncbi:adenosylcobinamide-GDP ribazoletransferase (plasmid) [Pseudorhodobacter turbinis]|uniref:Adenosylcobinamide-GDP ribazoletransferase n=1 Tax=Pseudorhodobacter turbinis TaxID=2500533 RepID=A0A4P8EL91_9RHOB|nr:adenosylcobinamide-GDP ribazoletransferase [Pseudorhodobacter turbinis]QCO57662.1 adenosylcobinamide-GDP ribazoletransferase [Pseudorhodobacter turbinis]